MKSTFPVSALTFLGQSLNEYVWISFYTLTCFTHEGLVHVAEKRPQGASDTRGSGKWEKATLFSSKSRLRHN